MKRLSVLCSLIAAASLAAYAQTTTRPAPRTPKPELTPEAGVAATPVPAPAAAPATGAATATGAAAATVEPPEKTVERFFSALQRKEVDQAYDQLTKGTKIAERAEDVKMLKSKTKDAIAVFGAMGGFELIAKKNVGERLVSYTYVSLGKEFPLRWRFYFYKPADSWRLIDLRVDDRLAAIFDEPEPAAASRD